MILDSRQAAIDILHVSHNYLWVWQIDFCKDRDVTMSHIIITLIKSYYKHVWHLNNCLTPSLILGPDKLKTNLALVGFTFPRRIWISDIDEIVWIGERIESKGLRLCKVSWEITNTSHLGPKGSWREDLIWVKRVLEGETTHRRIIYVNSV